MKSEPKHITAGDWILFILSTTLIFLSSILLILSTVIFGLLRLLKRRPILTFVSLAVLIILLVIVKWTVLPVHWRAEADSVSILIEPGDSMVRVVGRMNQANLIRGGTGLLLLSKILGQDKHIQTGRYDFHKGVTLYSIFRKLAHGEVTLRKVTIPEGLTIREIAGILQQGLEIDSAEFIRLATDRKFARSLEIPADNLEGYLFPDTYRFSWETTPEEAIEVLVRQFQKTFDDSLRRRAEKIGFSVAKAVTLASMIEAEARDGQERNLISAVYHNRLRLGMLLQCDPTVAYALPDLDRPLLLKDLEVDSPYNTYEHAGLPPGPICNPGKASILAALYPADVDYLYFVARGDGTHIFSTTLRQHNNAKLRIRQVGGSR
jgi:UPF0755 protein